MIVLRPWFVVIAAIVCGLAAGCKPNDDRRVNDDERVNDDTPVNDDRRVNDGRNVNIVDFENPAGRVPWKAEDLFPNADAVSLATAVRDTDKTRVSVLLAKGVSIDVRGKDEVTPLAWSYMLRNKAMFTYLLEQGADPNHFVWGKSPILEIVAGDSTDPEWLALALRFKGNPDLQNKHDGIPYGRHTPIFSAIRRQNIASVRLLIKAGADLDHRTDLKFTPAMEAATQGSYEIVYELLAAGAKVDLKDVRGNNLAYHVICTPVKRNSEPDYWREKVIAFLEEQGVRFNDEINKVSAEDRDFWLKYHK